MSVSVGENSVTSDWDEQLLELQQAAEQFEQRYSDGSTPVIHQSRITTESPPLEEDACSKLFDQVVFGASTSRTKQSVHVCFFPVMMSSNKNLIKLIFVHLFFILPA